MLSDGAPLKRVMWKNTHAVAEQQFSATFADVSSGLLHVLCSVADLNVKSKTLLPTCLMHI